MKMTEEEIQTEENSPDKDCVHSACLEGGNPDFGDDCCAAAGNGSCLPGYTFSYRKEDNGCQ